MPQTDPLEIAIIRKACEGLTYPSETDVPFDAVWWPAETGTARVAIERHAAKGATIETVPVPVFFKELEGAEESGRYRELRRVLESTLSELTVFRVGAIRIDVYLVGRLRSGAWAGVHTVSVET